MNVCEKGTLDSDFVHTFSIFSLGSPDKAMYTKTDNRL